MSYGNRFAVDRNGVTVIIDGFWLSLRQSLSTGQWRLKLTTNLWRRTKTSCPSRAEQAAMNKIIKGNT